MSKQKLIKKLASLYGIIPEYIDMAGKLNKITYNECVEFLKIIGFQSDQIDNLEESIYQIEFEKWNQWIPPVLVIKQPELPVIQLRLSKKELGKPFEWVLIEENGNVHRDWFTTQNLSMSIYRVFKKRGTFYQFALPLPVNPGMGYHTLKIINEAGKEVSMKLIVTPEKCYIPPAMKDISRINGPRLDLYNKDNFLNADYRYIRSIINNISIERATTVAIGAINTNSLNHDEKFVSYLPSNRFMFNVVFLNLEDIMDYLEDRSIQLSLLLNEFYEKGRQFSKGEDVEFSELYKLKLKILKKLYYSFREYHINVNSPRSKEFQFYLSQKGDILRNLSLFEALQEYFYNEFEEYKTWHEWPEAYQNPDSEVVKSFLHNNIELVQFYEFLQWQADIQLGEAGKASYRNGLNIGLFSTLPFNVDPEGSATWLNQDYFAFGARYMIEKPEENDTPVYSVPMLPHKLIENAYEYFINYIRPNMNHVGAIEIDNIIGLEYLHWFTSEDFTDKGFFVKYPLEDLLGIIALESHRQRCMIISDDYTRLSPRIKQIIMRYGIVTRSVVELKDVVNEEEARNLFGKVRPDIDIDRGVVDPAVCYLEDTFKTRIPLATYRFQFNQDFTFRDAMHLVPYLKKLGVTHCYASPLLCSRENSTHGYDIINHNAFNPSLGSIDDFYQFVDELHRHDMGLIVDIVPNHMGVNKENAWWMDVLENGPSSEYATYFDIDWNPLKAELFGKVLIPVLGDHYGNILASGQLKFKFSQETGKITLYYYEHEFPINPSSYPVILDYRSEVLATRIGSSSTDYLEYQSIITEFKNLPRQTETDPERIKERIREKDIAFKRLASLCQHNYRVGEFIIENLYDFQAKPNDPVSHRRLHNLLEEQAYRLAYWRVSSDEINYRRFFDINELAGLAVNNPAVFTGTHKFILDLVKQGKIDGLRIDHPDGLYDPAQYFYRLQDEAARKLRVPFDPEAGALLGKDTLPIYVVVEKILAPFERLPEIWAVHGSVGYEFLNSVCNLFVDKDNEKKFTRIYHRFIGAPVNFQELVVACKKLIMNRSLTGELNVLSNYINKISESYFKTRDYTLNSLRDALIEVIAHFPVYRTYITSQYKSNKDVDYIKWAVGAAEKQSLTTDPSIFDFIEKVLLVEFEEDTESEEYQQILRFAMKFQQYTGPLMAKGLEDTSFYRYNRLIALNEVGGEPIHFGLYPNDFHTHNKSRQDYTPFNMLSTSTHDTKRSEDVRARLCVLSEIPDIWQKKVNRWSHLNKMKKTTVEEQVYPDKNDEYLFYQTLVGIWPSHTVDETELKTLIERLEGYMIKATREAKNHTSWVNVNSQYEEALCSFIRRVLTAPEKHPFWKDFLPFQQEIALRGYLNSVSQALVKFTVPGVPDIYQGNEIIDLSLVDPDNRRPVDYQYRREALDNLWPLIEYRSENQEHQPEIFSEMLLPMHNDNFKLFVTTVCLNFRREHSSLFNYGVYYSLNVIGELAENLVSYCRKLDNEAIMVVIPRLMYRFVSSETPWPIGEDIWGETAIEIPEVFEDFEWHNVFTDDKITNVSDKILVARVFNLLPVALFHGKKKEAPTIDVEGAEESSEES
jgi:(1->4)-alpha-D-glucan 1-alpha-D-glucosylmutase